MDKILLWLLEINAQSQYFEITFLMAVFGLLTALCGFMMLLGQKFATLKLKLDEEHLAKLKTEILEDISGKISQNIQAVDANSVAVSNYRNSVVVAGEALSSRLKSIEENVATSSGDILTLLANLNNSINQQNQSFEQFSGLLTDLTGAFNDHSGKVQKQTDMLHAFVNIANANSDKLNDFSGILEVLINGIDNLPGYLKTENNAFLADLLNKTQLQASFRDLSHAENILIAGLELDASSMKGWFSYKPVDEGLLVYGMCPKKKEGIFSKSGDYVSFVCLAKLNGEQINLITTYAKKHSSRGAALNDIIGIVDLSFEDASKLSAYIAKNGKYVLHSLSGVVNAGLSFVGDKMHLSEWLENAVFVSADKDGIETD